MHDLYLFWVSNIEAPNFPIYFSGKWIIILEFVGHYEIQLLYIEEAGHIISAV